MVKEYLTEVEQNEIISSIRREEEILDTLDFGFYALKSYFIVGDDSDPVYLEMIQFYNIKELQHYKRIFLVLVKTNTERVVLQGNQFINKITEDYFLDQKIQAKMNGLSGIVIEKLDIK